MLSCPCCKQKTLITIDCKCGLKTCIKCRYPRHNCTYDFKTNGKQKLAKDNVKIVADKIIKI